MVSISKGGPSSLDEARINRASEIDIDLAIALQEEDKDEDGVANCVAEGIRSVASLEPKRILLNKGSRDYGDGKADR